MIFRASRQWFISVDHDGLRQKALDEIHKVRWLPKWGEDRITNMIAARPDWCISRQRLWGVPITVFYCESCEEPLLDPAIGRHVVGIFRREGADAWYKRSPEELMPPGTRCPKCKGSKFYKEKDILDVWFDSGSSHLAVLGDREDLPWPSDLYLEAGDQHRGWFHSSLLIGVALRPKRPLSGGDDARVGHGPDHRRRDVEIRRQRDQPRRRGRGLRGGDSPALGGLRGCWRGRDGIPRYPRPPLGSLPEVSQHLPILSGESLRF